MFCSRVPVRGVLDHQKAYSIIEKASLVFLFAFVAGQCLAQAPQGSDEKGKKEFHTAKDRLQAIRDASVYSPKPAGEADIKQGPPQNKTELQLHFNDKVICDFDTPGSRMGGKTAKFGCKITRVESADGQVQTLNDQTKEEEAVKVKFGADDNEVYAEVAASRLLWALGFYTDAWYPVRVECHNCPADPESGNGAKDTRTFDPAIIVRKFKGHKVYEAGNEDEGWSWKELEQVNGRPTYEKDALELLGAFIVHGDSKPPQQRLSCSGIKLDESTQPVTTTCSKSMLVVQDVGATFGGGGLLTSNDSAKANLDTWSGNKLWKKVGAAGSDLPQCQARLTKSLTAKDGLGDPIVGEEGRRFLAGLMCQLSDSQIADLFRVARIAQMPRYHDSNGAFKPGLNEASIVQQWVDAFKNKRDDLAAGRCKWKTQPADLKILDNPASLATVPNYCSSRPF
jgi:hypothetical protein